MIRLFFYKPRKPTFKFIQDFGNLFGGGGELGGLLEEIANLTEEVTEVRKHTQKGFLCFITTKVRAPQTLVVDIFSLSLNICSSTTKTKVVCVHPKIVGP